MRGVNLPSRSYVVVRLSDYPLILLYSCPIALLSSCTAARTHNLPPVIFARQVAPHGQRSAPGAQSTWFRQLFLTLPSLFGSQPTSSLPDPRRCVPQPATRSPLQPSTLAPV